MSEHAADATPWASNPPDAGRESVVRGHQRIMKTLREFGRGGEERDVVRDRAAARALAAFLRHEILPFARREEHLFAADSAEYEATTFEHAFLAAEIDALACAVDRWQADPGEDAGCARDVERRIHRVEAILELHTARHAERWLDGVGCGPVGSSYSDRAVSRRQGARPLTDSEIENVLRRHWWGVLSTGAQGRPYAVPVAYGMEIPHLYVASSEGRKVRNLETDPAVCLTVVEVVSGSDWTSVVVTGTVEWVSGALETLAAVRALQRQSSRPLSMAASDAARLIGARVMRIVPTGMTGRRRDPQ